MHSIFFSVYWVYDMVLHCLCCLPLAGSAKTPILIVSGFYGGPAPLDRDHGISCDLKLLTKACHLYKETGELEDSF